MVRLYELFEAIPFKDTLNTMRTPSDRFTSTRSELLGSGSFARVFQDRDNPHEVMKFSQRLGYETKIDDNYLYYLLEIAKDEDIQDNPWVPRILHFKLHRNENNEIVDFSVRLEALHRFEDINTTELLALAERILKPNAYDVVIQARNFTKERYSVSARLIGFIRQCIVDPTEARNITQDEYLINYAHWYRDALQRTVDRQARTNRNVYADIRDVNIMIRRTPYGIQPVITDPWA